MCNDFFVVILTLNFLLGGRYATVKLPLGIPSPIVKCLLSIPSSALHPSFFLMQTLGGNRWWGLEYLGLHHSHERSKLHFCVWIWCVSGLILMGIWVINQRMKDLFLPLYLSSYFSPWLSLSLPPCLSNKTKQNKYSFHVSLKSSSKALSNIFTYIYILQQASIKI